MAGLGTVAQAGAGEQELPGNAMRYQTEYPAIGYSDRARRNCFARLQAKLDSGEVQLAFDPKWGYLESLLKALDIDVDSQLMVFSKTSLQTEHIAAATPRAIYFNDDCYVAWVQHSTLLEFVALDAERGVVFYALENQQAQPPRFAREGGRCLTCHDTYSMMGGGVPRILVMSAPVESPADPRRYTSASEVTDRTPVSQRWGGWYTTGHHGRQEHLGNLPLRGQSGNTEALFTMSPSDRETLEGYFDTSAYLSDRSDIPALLVFEHQAYVQNLIVRANYKVRTVMSRAGQASPQGAGGPRSWEQVVPQDQKALRAMMEPLVKALFFVDAAPLEDGIVSSTAFARSFAARGPHDSQERSLRELDLKTRVFRWPLSYMVYTEAFDSLPDYAWDYLATRIVEVLEGGDTTGLSARIPETDRRAVISILRETHPRLAARLSPGLAQR